MTPEREIKRRKAVRQALERLERDGRLTPEAVLAEARDPQHVLHAEFEWDDAVAGGQYRLMQARRLIRSIVDVLDDATREISVVRYVRDATLPPDQQGYVSMDQARQEPATAAAIMAYELARVEAILKRAENLSGALGMRQEVRDVRGRVGRLARRVQESKG